MQPSSIPGLISPLNWLVQIFSQIWLGRKVFLIKKIKMKAETNVTTKPSTPEIVEVFMSKLKYPLFDVVEYLRKFILSADKEICIGLGPNFLFALRLSSYQLAVVLSSEGC
jgi:hypothetical protein